MKFFWKYPACLGFAASLAACNTTNIAERALVDPGIYAIYSCKELYTAIDNEKVREERLRGLMAKAESGPAGGLMSTLAYRGDYLQSRGNQLAAQQTLKDKKCPPRQSLR